MESIASVDSLVVQQIKENVEIFTSFETANKYRVCSVNGAELFYAAELGGSFLMRQFLNNLRPFEIKVTSPNGSEGVVLKRPFRFYFHELEVQDTGGVHLGTVKRKFSWLRRVFQVLDAQGHERFQLFGPLLKPWTFFIKRGDREVGKITKKWSGALKEAFTDADNFGVTFPADLPVAEKSLLLGAVFLIDFAYFEKSNRSS